MSLMDRHPCSHLCNYSSFIIIFNQTQVIIYFLSRILKQDEQKSASHGRAIQQRHQQLTRHNYSQEESPNYESDFESESSSTEGKEVRLSKRQPRQDDDEEEAHPVSEITDEASKISRGGKEVLYSDTFLDLSSSFTSQSQDHSGERSSRASRSCDDRFKRQDSAHKIFKDAVVQTQLVPPTFSLTAG